MTTCIYPTDMTEYTLSNGSILKNGEKVGEIIRESGGMRTSSITITGTPSFRIERDDLGSFRILRNGGEVGKEYRGLKLEYEGQTYEVSRRELSGFPTGMSNTLHVMSGGMVTGTIAITSSGLTASSDFNPDVMLIYLAFLAPYASASSAPMRYYGNYRGPMPASYRIISLVLGLSALAFLGIGDGISTNFLNPLDSFAIFVVLAILSYAVRIIGRRKGRSMESV